MKRTKRVQIRPGTVERDIVLCIPGGQEVLIQYRNYEGDPITGNGATMDVLLGRTRTVHNWSGSEMTPAKALRGSSHVRRADQLMWIIE